MVHNLCQQPKNCQMASLPKVMHRFTNVKQSLFTQESGVPRRKMRVTAVATPERSTYIYIYAYSHVQNDARLHFCQYVFYFQRCTDQTPIVTFLVNSHRIDSHFQTNEDSNRKQNRRKKISKTFVLILAISFAINFLYNIIF